MRLVVALGGNAILRRGEKGTADEQFGHVHYAAANLTAIVQEGHRIAITHGNGPQVGDILLANECAKDTLPRMPLDVCGAESQGMLGYMIQQGLENALRTAGINRRVITVVTQTVVDRGDPAFSHPSKPIGPFYGETEARQAQGEGGMDGPPPRRGPLPEGGPVTGSPESGRGVLHPDPGRGGLHRHCCRGWRDPCGRGQVREP